MITKKDIEAGRLQYKHVECPMDPSKACKDCIEISYHNMAIGRIHSSALSLLESLEKDGEKIKKVPTQIPSFCPDNRPGCAVAHFEYRISERDEEFNKGVDTVLSLIKQYKEQLK